MFFPTSLAALPHCFQFVAHYHPGRCTRLHSPLLLFSSTRLAYSQYICSHSSPSMPLKMAWQSACQVLVHQRWSHLVSPTFVVSMKVRSPLSSRIASQQSTLNFGSTVWEPYRLHILMNFLSSSMILNLLGSWRPLNEHLHRAVIFFSFWFPKSLRALTKLSHTPCGGACARKALASRRSALSGMTKILFRFLQSYWPPHAAHHQLPCFFQCFVETNQMWSVSGYRCQ